MPHNYLFSSESVTEGHPDKICDQISDAILDAILCEDPLARVAAECMVTTGLVIVTGEITTKAQVNISEIARQVIADIGYVGEHGGGFDAHSCGIITAVNKQNPEIASCVDRALERRVDNSSDTKDHIGAGDQGMMFGFACRETPELMSMPISAAHRIARRLSEVRKAGILKYLRPDGKTQVTIQYEEGRPVRVHSLIVSTQHDPAIDGISDKEKVQQRIAEDLKKYVVLPAFQDLAIRPDAETCYYLNPSGSFVVGGPQGDAGLTGRKVVVDTYGGCARHGGGALSGKDPTKVDRTGAYAARYVAKNIVGSGLADRVEVQIAYAIGVARPVSIYVTTFGTGRVSDDDITELVKRHFDLRPAAIIAQFDLTNLPKAHGGKFYQKIAAYGHFGRTDIDLPWEKLDKVDVLQKFLMKAVSS